MPDKWGNNEVPMQVDCNMIPAAGRHNRLKVVDVDTNDVDEPAIHAINENAGANALALRVEGVSKLEGRTKITGPLEVGDNIVALGGGGITFGDEVHFEGAALLENGGEFVEMFTFQLEAVMNGKTQFKGNDLILNNALNITDTDPVPVNGGAGFKFAANGGDPRINVYINGAIVAYFDSTGCHNA